MSMTTKAISAKAEGMPPLNRRSFIGKSALAIPAMGMAAIVPADAEPVVAKHPWDVARELANELSHVLADGDGAFGGPGGEWFAEVHPSADNDYPVMFGSISSRHDIRRKVSTKLTKLIDDHGTAREAFGKACDATDRTAPGKEPSKAASALGRKASRAETAALVAVCSHHPHGRADGMAKAKYLRQFIAGGEFQREHIVALVNSAVPL